ncbi:head-tail adaptor protein [Parvularcula sp. LCG005]|uniref:head-tail adaptor protein n=1 Tax=Parvularcula sp. LCG005 TaxID=3078805 RepID=UPI0029435BFE|nr:head-tail adaptor protein [Parvularcula sp. LCG005]WOI53994.1 head-tail adaptor protein [Parvularcula sp. LCG005]
MIGDLRAQVTVLMPAPITDAGGGFEPSYDAGTNVDANVESLSSRRTSVAGRDRFRRRYRLTMRYQEAIGFSARIVYRGVVHRITDIRAGGDRQRTHTLTMEEIV